MSDLKLRNKHYTVFAWGVLFLLLGVLMLIPGDQSAIFVLGAGIIFLGLNLVRKLNHIPVSLFSTILGVLALGLGAVALFRHVLHVHFELPIFPVLLIWIGLYFLIPAAKPAGTDH